MKSVNNVNEIYERLEEIQQEFLDLHNETSRLLRQLTKEVGNRHILSRAESYWLAQLKMAITEDHGYLGSAGCSMEQTLDEIKQLPWWDKE